MSGNNQAEKSTGRQALDVLRQTFGYESFRPHQGEIVQAALAGRDVLAVPNRVLGCEADVLGGIAEDGVADALREGPLAPLTDWGELAPVVARVRAAFAGSARVAELGEMIGKLRD